MARGRKPKNAETNVTEIKPAEIVENDTKEVEAADVLDASMEKEDNVAKPVKVKKQTKAKTDKKTDKTKEVIKKPRVKKSKAEPDLNITEVDTSVVDTAEADTSVVGITEVDATEVDASVVEDTTEVNTFEVDAVEEVKASEPEKKTDILPAKRKYTKRTETPAAPPKRKYTKRTEASAKVDKVEAVKAPEKKAVKEKAPKKITEKIVVQANGAEIDTRVLTEKAIADWVARGHNKSDLKSIVLYIKPDDWAAYYVINDIDREKIGLE